MRIVPAVVCVRRGERDGLELTAEQLAFKQSVEEFAQQVVAPRAAAIDESGEFPLDVMRAAAGRGLLGMTIPRGWGGARPRLRELRAGDRGDRQGERDGGRVAVGHQFAGRRAAGACRPGAAERAVAATAGDGRGDRRLRALRAGRRHRRRQSKDESRQKRRGLPDHRPESLGRERRSGGGRDRVRVHAARPARSGRDGVPGADGHAGHHANGARRLPRRPGPRLHRSRSRHPRRRRPGPGPGRPGVRPRDVGAPGRARRDRRPRRSASARQRWTKPSRTPSTGRRSAIRSATTRRFSGCWPTSRPSSKRRAC